MRFKGFIFDLDGTLVDSQLNFEKLRNDLGLPPDSAILEEVSLWPLAQQKWAHQIIEEHELHGAQISTLYPGVKNFFGELESLQAPVALFTRNSRKATELTLQKHQLSFNKVITRDDAPAKPDPSGLLTIAQSFLLDTSEILYVGDYMYDLMAGLAAQMPTALYLPQQHADFDTEGAHLIFDDFSKLRHTLQIY